MQSLVTSDARHRQAHTGTHLSRNVWPPAWNQPPGLCPSTRASTGIADSATGGVVDDRKTAILAQANLIFFVPVHSQLRFCFVRHAVDLGSARCVQERRERQRGSPAEVHEQSQKIINFSKNLQKRKIC